MKLFSCQSCGQILFFENTQCEKCGHRLGYLPVENDLSALEQADGNEWHPLALGEAAVSRFCANEAPNSPGGGVCNWLVPADSAEEFCLACRLNRTIPDLSVEGNAERWRLLESAKHRLIYTLMRLNLPIRSRAEDPEGGLAFDFVDDAPDGTPAMTGHDEGIITIALKESDDAERERMRMEMGEHYRTLLGHFRHEIGHYYWNVLVRDGGRLEECRAVFGDDSADYGEALKKHYETGAPADWQDHFVSEYATTHPWEDFAESFAHYLHIVSTLETARGYGLSVGVTISDDPALAAEVDFNPYRVADFSKIAEAWLPLTYAVNSLNRSMGQPDFYPFVLSPAVLDKLAFIHALVHGAPAP